MPDVDQITTETRPVTPDRDRPSRVGSVPGGYVVLVVSVAALVAAGVLVARSWTGPGTVEVVDAAAGGADGGATTATGETGETGAAMVEVSMTEFAFSPGDLELAAGEVTFDIVNDGVAPHQWALSAAGEHGVHLADTGDLSAGESTSMTLDLAPGVYEYACHIPGHFDAGMIGTLRVTDADGNVPTTPPADAHDEAAGDDHHADDAMTDRHDDEMADGHDEMADGHDEMADGHDDAMAGGHDEMAGEAPMEGHREDDGHGHDAGSADAPVADTIVVSMTEFAFSPDTLELPAGTYRFEIVNDGEIPHEWALAEAGEHHGHGATTDEIAPGDAQVLTVELDPGSYEYMCHLPGHLDAGMTATLRVTE